jgi:hypothetical protein
MLRVDSRANLCLALYLRNAVESCGPLNQFQQRATQQLAGDRQFATSFWACARFADEPFTRMNGSRRRQPRFRSTLQFFLSQRILC